MADTTSSTIVGPEQLAQIQDALKKLDVADQEIALAKRAGLHEVEGGQQITQFEQQSANARAILQRIKNTYFPNAT